MRKLIKQKTGVLLDVSLGGEPQANAVTFRDLRHDPRQVPWPLPDRCVANAVVTHVVEFLEPDDVFPWFDELHRVLRVGGMAYLSGPYGGDDSIGWLSDPTHKTRMVESTLAWLDPSTPIYPLNKDVGRPLPRPWKVIVAARIPGSMGSISYNMILQATALNHDSRERQNGSNGKAKARR